MAVAAIACAVPAAGGDPVKRDARVSATQEALTSARPDVVPAGRGVRISLEGSLEEQGATASGTLETLEGALYLSAKVASPIGKGVESATIVDLSGLRSGGSLELGATLLLWEPNVDKAKLQALCDKHQKKPCDTTQFTTREEREAAQAAVSWGVPIFAGLRGSLGYQRYEYLDPATLVPGETPFVPFSVGAKVAVLAQPVGLFQLGFDYGLMAQAGESSQICRPIGTTGSTRCDDVALGAPTIMASTLVRLEYRRWLGSSAGISPVLAYDVTTRAMAAQISLWVLQAAKTGGLNGGATLGWRSDTNAVGVSIFVGTELSMAP